MNILSKLFSRQHLEKAGSIDENENVIIENIEVQEENIFFELHDSIWKLVKNLEGSKGYGNYTLKDFRDLSKNIYYKSMSEDEVVMVSGLVEEVGVFLNGIGYIEKE